MAINTLDYAQFQSECNSINSCISNIEQEMNTANQNLQSATQDASGTWANADVEDWNRIYTDIKNKFDRLQVLMQVAGSAAQSTSDTENTYAGFNVE